VAWPPKAHSSAQDRVQRDGLAAAGFWPDAAAVGGGAGHPGSDNQQKPDYFLGKHKVAAKETKFWNKQISF